MIGDRGKLLLLGLVMVVGPLCGTLLLLTHAIDQGAGAALISGALFGPLGYLTGNGRLAAKGDAPMPAIVARAPDPDGRGTVVVAKLPGHIADELEHEHRAAGDYGTPGQPYRAHNEERDR